MFMFFSFLSANTVIIEEAGKIKALLIHNEPIFYNGKALLRNVFECAMMISCF